MRKTDGPPQGPIPPLRFPEFRDAGPWEVRRLGKVANVLPGYGFPEIYQGKRAGKYPFYKVSDISNALASGDYLIESAANFVDDNDLGELGAKTIPIGTTIFAKIGEAIRSNRRAITTRECVIDNNVAGIKAKENYASDLFIYYILCQVYLMDYSGGVVPSVNKTALENIPLACPDLREQQKIADCLTSLDDLIRAEEKALATLREHKRGLMWLLFPGPGENTPPLRFSEFQNAGPWESMKIGEILALEYGAPLPEDQRADGPVPVVGSNGVVGFHNESLIEGPAIVVGRKGSAGQVSWVDTACYPIDTTFYVALRRPDCELPFLWWLIERHQLPDLVSLGGVPGLNRNDVYVVKTALPNKEEQQKIADCLASLDNLIRAEEERVASLKAHKRGLMQQLFPQEVG